MKLSNAAAARNNCIHGFGRAVLAAGLTLSSSMSWAGDAREPGPAVTATSEMSITVPVLRRLSRFEYANSLRDLFGIDFPFTAELPPDGQAEGFENIGDALSLSPVLLEGYLKAARKVSDLVLGIGTVSPITQQFPATDGQSTWQEGMPLGTRGGVKASYYFPRTGEYELRAILDNKVGITQASVRHTPHEGVNFFRTRAHISAGVHSFVATFPDLYAEHEGLAPGLDGPGGRGLGGPLDIQASAIRPTLQFWLDGKKTNTFEVRGISIGSAAFEAQIGPPILARLEITGPFNPENAVDTEPRRHLLTCTPRSSLKEKVCAEKILTRVARRAYRREVTAADMAPILASFASERANTTFDESVAMGLRHILMSPDFLFRVERAPAQVSPGQIYQISDYELATRLSYFIWSSLPDDELLELARRNRLHQQQTLEQQLRRLLSDSRSQALVDNFAMSWLGLRDFQSIRPDLRTYPEFDPGLGRALEQETRLFLRSVLRENRSVLEVISSDYTFLNERLAQLYGIPGVEGPAFRRVSLKGNDQRGGLLSQGSVLMATSHAAQTSPILRGKWILSQLLNAPPQPPPSNVPPLNTKPEKDGRVLTTREQIERHRSTPVCVGCHAKMDPYGIALENYDVLGRWRTEENGSPIDTETSLPRGKPFTGPAGLKKLLLARSDDFVTATVSRLMTYALGRRLEDSDDEAVKQIVETAKPNGYRLADLVMGVVNSPPFRMRQAHPIAQVATAEADKP